MKNVQFSAILDNVSKKRDNTISIKLGTQELGSEDTSHIFDFCNKQIWVAFAEVPLTENDIAVPEFIPEFEGQKSYSQRVKEVLYRVWETTDKKKTSRQFYEDYMEKLIENLKSKLS